MPSSSVPIPRIARLTGTADPYARVWRVLRDALYGEEGSPTTDAEFKEILNDQRHRGMPYAVLLAVNASARPGEGILGFVEVSCRRFADGCQGDPVGYIEGLLVVPQARRHGIGKALMQVAEQWAIRRGCVEMGSDAEVDNEASAKAHEAMGYEEVSVIRCFRKGLSIPYQEG